jgi:acetyltransferase-like isoleucine patch superfamily enzyme
VGKAHRILGQPSILSYGGAIDIGDRFVLSSRPVVSHLAVGPGASLEIGDDVWIGHGGAISAFERVRIGAGTQIGPFVIIMDTNFHGGSGDQSVRHECRPVIIGAGCRIGSRVTITRGSTIGDGAEILAGSVVSAAIPPGACAGGARARVVGRAGDASARWDGAAAMLPVLTMDILGLDAPPELEERVSARQDWSDQVALRFVDAVESQFGVRLDRASINKATRLSDLVAAIDAVRTPRRSG